MSTVATASAFPAILCRDDKPGASGLRLYFFPSPTCSKLVMGKSVRVPVFPPQDRVKNDRRAAATLLGGWQFRKYAPRLTSKTLAVALLANIWIYFWLYWRGGGRSNHGQYLTEARASELSAPAQ